MKNNPLSMAAFAMAALTIAVATFTLPSTAMSSENSMWKFDFSTGPTAVGFTKITPDTLYTSQRGFGFESAVEAGKPFLFSVAVPEGNYRVSLTLGDAVVKTITTVKAESRRLMLENIETAPGVESTHTFTVNVRNAQLKSGGAVGLKAEEQQNHLNWDEKLTLEFNGAHPRVSALEIAKADDAVTVYLAGDSTVTDQKSEPWAAWGQVLPRFFDSGVAISNHAQSGEALYSFRAEKRLEKILDSIQPGDYLFIQFGHNDQKDKSRGAGAFTTYKDNLKYFVAQARMKSAIPILVTPMERRRFEGDKPLLTLSDYAEAVRGVGREQSVPVIDLHAMSLQFYAALGPEHSKKAFVHYAANTFLGQTQALKDDTHFNAYGAYQLAKCVVEGIKSQVPALSKYLRPTEAFNPNHPDAFENWKLPASPNIVVEKPEGN